MKNGRCWYTFIIQSLSFQPWCVAKIVFISFLYSLLYLGQFLHHCNYDVGVARAMLNRSVCEDDDSDVASDDV